MHANRDMCLECFAAPRHNLDVSYLRRVSDFDSGLPNVLLLVKRLIRYLRGSRMVIASAFKSVVVQVSAMTVANPTTFDQQKKSGVTALCIVTPSAPNICEFECSSHEQFF